MADRTLDSELIHTERMKLKHERALELARSRMQAKLVVFTCCCVGLGFLGALSMFFLEGFGKESGFHLDAPFMHWIGTATIGCVSTLAILVYKCFFPGSQQRKSRSRTARVRRT